MKIVATTIGTRVYYGFETTAGVRPTKLNEYTLLEDCTSHPDFNPEREQIETTTLIQENNKTYTSGLKDFGSMEFGFNLTQDVLDIFLTEGTGILDAYKANMEDGKRLWLCVDIRFVDKSFYIPVEPQDFGLPEGSTNSKYELSVRFTATGDGIWADDPIVTFGVTNTLTNATTSNDVTEVAEGSAYAATLTAAEGYTLEGATVSVTMGGVDITSTAYDVSTNEITIANVNGAVVVTATAVSL